MNDNAKAASILRQYAGELYQGHTIGGEWECAQIEAQHDEMMALADRLALADAGGAVAWRFNVDGMWFTASKREYCHKAIADAGIEAEIEPLYTHPAPSADRVAELEAQLAESRERVARAYGLLWHVNAGIDAPWGTPSLTPERAAMESRKVLRDMLTSEQRGDGINAARDLMKALAADQEKNDE